MNGPPHQLYPPTNSETTTPRRVDIIIQEAVRLWNRLWRNFWLTQFFCKLCDAATTGPDASGCRAELMSHLWTTLCCITTTLWYFWLRFLWGLAPYLFGRFGYFWCVIKCLKVCFLSCLFLSFTRLLSSSLSCLLILLLYLLLIINLSLVSYNLII